MNKSRLLFGIFLFGFLVPGLLLAQYGSIEGRIVNAETNEPLPGANVLVAGTHIGAATYADGRFTLTRVPAGTHTIEARFVGFRSSRQQVTIEAGIVLELNFELTSSALQFDDIIVTGQARETRRREIGAVITSISTEGLQEAPVTSLSQLLQARAPGVLVQQSSGSVGMSSRIMLRGPTSLSQGVQPVIYVDGVRVDNSVASGVQTGGNTWSGLDDINWADVERVEVIKGASASTLYGTQAASGVIQIFTKDGRREARATSWTYNAQAGWNHVPASFLEPVSVYANWFQEEIMRTGFYNQHQLSATGSVGGYNYYASLTYQDNQGMYKTNKVDYLNFRGNLQFLPREDLVLRINQAFSERSVFAPQDGNNIYSYLGNGLYGGPRGDFFQTDLSDYFDVRLKSMRYQGSITMEYQPISDFNTRMTVGIDLLNTDNTEFVPYQRIPLIPLGRKINTRRNSNLGTLEIASVYTTGIGNTISSNLTAGFQAIKHDINWVQGVGRNFPMAGLETIGTAAITTSNEHRQETREYGFFVQERLGFYDIAFLTFGLRADRHSAFGIDFGWGWYPSVGISYVVSDHSFWQELFHDTEFRVRAQYGEAGRPPGTFDHLRTWTAIAARDGEPAVTTDNLGNPDLGPEVSQEMELGFDVSLWSNRINVELTYYNQKTQDALLPVRFPPSGGFLATQLENVASVDNRGLEIAFRSQIFRTNFLSWDAGINYSTNENEITEMADVPETTVQWSQRNRVGYPVASFFADRIEFDADGQLFLNEDTYIGPAFPTKTFQFSSNLNILRNININVLLDHAGGHYIQSSTMVWGALLFVAPDDPVLGEEYWNKPVFPATRQVWIEREQLQAEGLDANDPMNYSDPIIAAYALSAFVNLFQREDGSIARMPTGNHILKADYWRLREVTVSYNIPARFVRNIGMRNATIYVTGRNLWRDVNELAMETEVNYQSFSEYTQQEALVQPLPRTYIIGLRFNF